jgi:hypothetical protein
MTPQLSSQRSAKWIGIVARVGYTAKGIVYVLIGVLAFQAALNWGGEVTDSTGALDNVPAKPMGKISLFLIALGLVSYVFWRMVQAIYNPESNGKDNVFKALSKRIASLMSALVYGTLAFSAFKIVFGSGGGSNESSSDEQTAIALSQPFGRWLVGAVGVGIIAFAFYCFYKAIKGKFRHDLNFEDTSPATKKWLIRIASFGISTKGVVLTIIGYFLIKAARLYDSDQTKNTEDVLEMMQRQEYGAWLIGFMAIGLVAYGFYYMLQARYRRI